MKRTSEPEEEAVGRAAARLDPANAAKGFWYQMRVHELAKKLGITRQGSSRRPAGRGRRGEEYPLLGQRRGRRSFVRWRQEGGEENDGKEDGQEEDHQEGCQKEAC